MPQEFHLAIEGLQSHVDACPGLRAGKQRQSDSFQKLVLPSDGVSYLEMDDNGLPVFSAPGSASTAPVALEALQTGQRPVLAMVSQAGAAPRVNGASAPPATVLWEKDVLQLPGCAYLLHVCVFSVPEIGPPRPDEAGELCAYCKTELLPDSTVYRCQCGKSMHLEEEAEESSEDALQCARLAGRCITCNRPLMLVRGYGYLPPFLDRAASHRRRRPPRSRRRARVAEDQRL